MPHRREAELYRNAVLRLGRAGSPQFRLMDCQIELLLIRVEDIEDASVRVAHLRILKDRSRWERLDEGHARELIREITNLASVLDRLSTAEVPGS